MDKIISLVTISFVHLIILKIKTKENEKFIINYRFGYTITVM